MPWKHHDDFIDAASRQGFESLRVLVVKGPSWWRYGHFLDEINDGMTYQQVFRRRLLRWGIAGQVCERAPWLSSLYDMLIIVENIVVAAVLRKKRRHGERPSGFLVTGTM